MKEINDLTNEDLKELKFALCFYLNNGLIKQNNYLNIYNKLNK